mmetsp:Transcript_28983/g.92550  ORF Transcript_28983/g.92550 Transcript_28983/m.92550 type:complete len:355 (-) Transcript_28983:65-1129(-)
MMLIWIDLMRSTTTGCMSLAVSPVMPLPPELSYACSTAVIVFSSASGVHHSMSLSSPLSSSHISNSAPGVKASSSPAASSLGSSIERRYLRIRTSLGCCWAVVAFIFMYRWCMMSLASSSTMLPFSLAPAHALAMVSISAGSSRPCAASSSIFLSASSRVPAPRISFWNTSAASTMASLSSIAWSCMLVRALRLATRVARASCASSSSYIASTTHFMCSKNSGVRSLRRRPTMPSHSSCLASANAAHVALCFPLAASTFCSTLRSCFSAIFSSGSSRCSTVHSMRAKKESLMLGHSLLNTTSLRKSLRSRFWNTSMRLSFLSSICACVMSSMVASASPVRPCHFCLTYHPSSLT